MSDKKSNWKHAKSKARAWAFIAYPESAPEDWKDILQKTGLSIAISPLHNSDKDPTEEDKKPHWHIIAVWANTTTGISANRISESIKGVLPIPLNAVKGYYRYLTHKDNPEKYQYDEKDITCLNGFNMADFIELTKGEVARIKRKLQDFIIEHKIVEYCDLMDYLLVEGTMEEYDIASCHTYFFDKYISSRRNSGINTSTPIKCNPETGEVIA